MTSVEQALEKHGAKETLSDVKCSKTNTEVYTKHVPPSSEARPVRFFEYTPKLNNAT